MNLTSAILRSRKQLTYDVFELEFETEEPFNFKAGQFVTIEVPATPTSPKPVFRSYSISSRPHKTDEKQNRFSLLVKILENGIGSNYLKSLEPDSTGTNSHTPDSPTSAKSTINFLGPIGHFTFKTTQTDQETSTKKNAIFIATGTGLASIKSIIEDELINKDSKQTLTLFFGLRYIKDIFYKDFFDNLAKKFPNFSYTITLSQPETPDWHAKGGTVGRVTTLLETIQTNQLAQTTIPASSNNQLDPLTTEAYICGLKDMIESVTTLLAQKSFPKESIHFERFN